METNNSKATKEIAYQIKNNTQNGDFNANYDNFYADDVVAYEPEGNAFGVVRELKGRNAIAERANGFHQMIDQVLSRTTSEPLIAGEYFTFHLRQEFMLKGIGYFQLDELCLFRVKDGKIVREEYFY